MKRHNITRQSPRASRILTPRQQRVTRGGSFQGSAPADAYVVKLENEGWERDYA